MAVLMDPETELPEKKRKLTPAQIIMLLLYPVIFIVGLSVGLVIGLRQGEQNATQPTSNAVETPVTIIPNANNVVSPNTNDIINSSNSALNGGGFLELDQDTQADLTRQEEAEKVSAVDQSVGLADIVRQRDLISLKYDLKAYFAVNNEYPSTDNQQIQLDRGSSDILYEALREFYGGSYNEPIDAQHPTYYYGYTSNGQTFELTSFLVTQNKVYIVTEK